MLLFFWNSLDDHGIRQFAVYLKFLDLYPYGTCKLRYFFFSKTCRLISQIKGISNVNSLMAICHSLIIKILINN